MKIFVPTKTGVLAFEHTKHAEAADKIDGLSRHSFPITISEIPEGTKSLALTFIDYDAVPVCGFPWIHWLACDILPTAETIEIPQDASRVATEIMTQGKNSTYGSDKTGKIINGYVGPAPPDKDHEYLLTVYALDTELNLPTGFFLNELQKAIRGHILATSEIGVIGQV